MAIRRFMGDRLPPQRRGTEAERVDAIFAIIGPQCARLHAGVRPGPRVAMQSYGNAAPRRPAQALANWLALLALLALGVVWPV